MSPPESHIPLTPRTLGNNLDLALLLLRSGFRGYLAAWCWCCLPVLVLIATTGRVFDWTWPRALVAAVVASGFLGTLVASLTGQLMFGEPVSVAGACRRLGPRPWWFLLQRCFRRSVEMFALAMLVLPGVLLVSRWPFRTEARILRNIDPVLHGERSTKLLDLESSRVMSLWFSLAGYGVMLWSMLLLTADFASNWLLGTPLLMGRLGLDTAYASENREVLIAVFKFLWKDPVVLMVEVAIGLFVFVYLRITWFLCYLDLRVRDDCWDVELKLRRESERLWTGVPGRPQ
ncbi:MAG TPA: hypothetical protein DDY91_11085 [Planctomycetaceae bacterium]|nr:hypothetical protein [Planctomycetaceae bacterium]